MKKFYELLKLPWKIYKYKSLSKKSIRQIASVFAEYGQNKVIDIKIDEATQEAKLPNDLENLINRRLGPKREEELARLYQDPIIRIYDKVNTKISTFYYLIKSHIYYTLKRKANSKQL